MVGTKKTLGWAGLSRSWVEMIRAAASAAFALLACSAPAFAVGGCTGSGTVASPYVCSSATGLTRSGTLGTAGSSTINASNIPAGSKIQSITVSLTWNDGGPDDWALDLVGPNNPNTANLVFHGFLGCGNAFSGSVTYIDGGTNLSPDGTNCLAASGNFEPSVSDTFTNNAAHCTNPSLACYNVSFAAGSPGTLNYAQPYASSTLSSQFHGADPTGNWTLYGYTATSDAGPGITAWSISIVLAAGAATSTTLSTSPNPVLTTGTETLTATVTSSPSNPTIGTVLFQDNGSTISGCGAVAVGGSGTAVCTYNTPTPEGTHSLSAAYSDTTNTFVSSTGTKVLQVDTPTSNPTTNQYCNVGPLTNTSSPNALSNQYPSHLYVPLTSSISALTLTLQGVTSTDLGGFNAMLVAPDNTPYVVMSDIDGQALEGAITSNNLTFNLVDTGSAFPFGGALSNNANYLPFATTLGSFPASLTSGPLPAITAANFPSTIGTATFGTSFNGKNPNGTSGQPWSLYISGNGTATGNPLSITGWCLSFVTSSGAATITALASSANPSFVGDAVTFTATVTSAGSPVTTGTVTFKVDGVTMGSPVSLNGSGVATLTAPASGAGSLTEATHTIQAFYNGTASFNVSNGSLSQEVDTHTVISNNNTTFCNPGGISIPDVTGQNTPYPSRIFVTNVPGTISAITLNLKGFTMPEPETLDALLVGPQASTPNLVFLSQLGGQGNSSCIGITENPANNLNLTFSDAGIAAPKCGPLSSATYAPTTYRTETFSFPAPAPASPVFAATLGVGTLTSQFAGQLANGAWQLYSIQDTTQVSSPDNKGSFNQWCVNFTVTPPTVTVTETGPTPVIQGQTGQQYTITITDQGVGPTGGTMTVTPNAPDGGLTLTGLSSTDVNWDCSAGTSCTRTAPITDGANTTVVATYSVNGNASSPQHVSATVAGGGLTSSVTSTAFPITVTPAPSLQVTKTHVGTFTQGQTAEWDISVKNNAASGTTTGTVTVSDTLPPGYTVNAFTGTDATWSCSGQTTQTANCTSIQQIAGGNSFLPIKIIVNVPAGSPSLISNTAGAWGGGDPVHTSSGTAATGADSNVPVVQVPTQIAITGGNSQAATVGTAFTPLQITVKDAGGNAVGAGVNVTFTAPSTGASGTFANTTNTVTLATAADGTISAPFTANNTAGSYSVTLTSAGIGSPPSFSLTNNPGAASTIAITGGNSQAVTVGTAFSPLQIIVKDSFGNPVLANVNVTFTAPALTQASGKFANNLATTTLPTAADGTISTPFTADNFAGSYSVTVASAGVASPPSFSLTNNPGGASTITITGGNSQAVTIGTAFAALQIVVKDSFANPVAAGVSVTFTAPSTGASGTFANTTNTIALLTAADGTISAPFTANTVAGSYSVTLASIGVTTPPSFSLTNNPGPAAAITITGGDNQAVAIGTAFAPLQITVKDASGNPVLAGVNVTFTAPATGASGTFANSSNTVLLATLANGTISAPFTANNTVGAYSVTLASAGVTSPPSFSLTNNPGPPASITITGGNNQAVAVGTAFSPLQIIVKDSQGNPVLAGQNVTFAAPGTTNGTFANSTATITLATVAGGTISAPFTAGSLAGSYSVTLTAGGVASPPNFSLTNNPGPAATITITGGNSQSATVGTAFGTALQILVKDSFSNAVAAGVSVTFTAPSTGASGTFANSSFTTTLQTAAGGTISTPFTANNTAGAYSVTLASAGVSSPPSFSLTNNPGAASTISITGGNNQSAAINMAFSALQIQVKDSFGNGVASGVSVTFTAPSTLASGKFANSSNTTTLQTAAGGTISTPFTANSVTGSYSVTLASAGVSSPPSFSLMNTPGPAASITITGGNSQSVSIGTAFAPLQIVVKDAGGNAVLAGVNVTFTAPAVGASGTFSNASNAITLATLANGTISAPFTANVTGGAYLVTTASAGVSSPPSFSLANLAANVSGQVSVTQNGFARNRSTGLWVATMTVTNTGGTLINSPVQVLMTNITPGVTMFNNTGSSGGSPYITVTSGTLAPGASVSVSIEFTNPSNGFISYTPITYSGGL